LATTNPNAALVAKKTSRNLPRNPTVRFGIASTYYAAFHIKLPFLALDYTASAKCRFRHFAPFNG
jgi:hypothetical protein